MIIVNFATNEHANGQARLKKSLEGCNYKTLFFTDYKEINSPTHQESNYEFKVHSMEKASKIDPVVLWLDASLWLVGDITKVDTVIKKDGYIMQEGIEVGATKSSLSKWLDAKSRKYFGFTEGDIPTIESGMLGVDFNSEIGKSFFFQWKKAARAGQFNGSWSDHRHDQACASVIAWRMAMTFQPNKKYFAYIGEEYGEPPIDTVFHCRGIN